MWTGVLVARHQDVDRSVGSKASGCEVWSPGSKYARQRNRFIFFKETSMLKKYVDCQRLFFNISQINVPFYLL
jgi:hypothetical protein